MFAEADYTRALLAARRLHLGLTADVLKTLLAMLDDAGREIARAVRSGDANRINVVVRRVYGEIERLAQDSIRTGVRVQFIEIREVLDRVTLQALAEEGVSADFFRPRPALQQATAFLARTAPAFVSLSAAVKGAQESVSLVIAQGIASEWRPERIARAIRPYIRGHEAFTRAELEDLRRIPKAKREAAKRLRFLSERIAITETGMSAKEAQLETMAHAPMVESYGWNLSPVRGTQTTPDECDILAKQDFYGLGVGNYPLAKVPSTPHPHDRCWGRGNTRPVERWGDPKPNPGLIIGYPTELGVESLGPGMRARAQSRAWAVIEPASRSVAAA